MDLQPRLAYHTRLNYRHLIKLLSFFFFVSKGQQNKQITKEKKKLAWDKIENQENLLCDVKILQLLNAISCISSLAFIDYFTFSVLAEIITFYYIDSTLALNDDKEKKENLQKNVFKMRASEMKIYNVFLVN